MPTDFKTFADRELEHARDVLKKLDDGAWSETAGLRSHYERIIAELETALARVGGR